MTAMTAIIGTDDKPLTDAEIKEMQALTYHDGFNDAYFDGSEFRSRLPLPLHNEEYGRGWADGCRAWDLAVEHDEQVHNGGECDC